MIHFGLFKQCSKRMTCEVFVSSCTSDTKWKSIFAFLPFLPRRVVILIDRLSLNRHPRCSSLPLIIRYHVFDCLINPLASVSRLCRKALCRKALCRKASQCHQHKRTLGCRHGLSNRTSCGIGWKPSSRSILYSTKGSCQLLYDQVAQTRLEKRIYVILNQLYIESSCNRNEGAK
jgi:hypothetical protein